MKTLTLKEHQINAVTRFGESESGLILYHSLGSGKTVTSIACGELYPDVKKIVIVPASLQENYKKEILAFGADAKMYSVHSYESTVKKDDEYLKDCIVVVDEAHRLRNAYEGGVMTKNILVKLSHAWKIVLLTGTPIVNRPSDIAPLVNAVYKEDVFPTNAENFNKLYLSNYYKPKKVGLFAMLLGYFTKAGTLSAVTPRNVEKFKTIAGKVFDHYANQNVSEYPDTENITIRIVMSPLQQELHTKAARELLNPSDLALIKKKRAETKLGKSASRVNSFLSKTRQITNYVAGEASSPKFDKIFEIMGDGLRPTLIYSNFKDAGVSKLNEMLTEKGYTCALFTGAETMKKKKEAVLAYNTGKLDALLITASGAEGIDLKKTRKIIIMEPHWNQTRVDQAIGRGVRYLSHINLDLKNRNVTVYNLLSVYPTRFFKDPYEISSDVHLHDMSAKKVKVNDQFLALLT